MLGFRQGKSDHSRTNNCRSRANARQKQNQSPSDGARAHDGESYHVHWHSFLIFADIRLAVARHRDYRRSNNELCRHPKVAAAARMRAGSVLSRIPAPFPPTDFNNFSGCRFGTRIAHQHVKAQPWQLGRGVLKRRSARDSPSPSWMGPIVSRASVRQGIRLTRLRALRPMACR